MGSTRWVRARSALAASAAGVVAVALAVFALGSVSSAQGGDPCAGGGAERVYDVSAINVRMQVNRFGDHDPAAFMYVLDGRIGAVRAQERAKAVSTGLGDDAIQPLVLRANLGECLVVRFTNRLTMGGNGGRAPRVSVRALGLPRDAAAGDDAVGANGGPRLDPAPGERTTYRFALPAALGEGAHVFHSGGDARDLTSHGLFGTIIAEPAGARFLDPRTGRESDGTGWDAIIDSGAGPDFREFTVQYHEIGNESFLLTNADGRKVHMNDCVQVQCANLSGPGSGAYRPATRAINYRSEPFSRRMDLASPPTYPSPVPRVRTPDHPLDKSPLYSTYAFGDPPTPMARSYLGEPTKTRLVNVGSEMAHVHHLHGGGTRWRRNPGAEDTHFASGLDKEPPQDVKSTRLDSQTVSPGETFSLEHECGAGGCQQVAGDYLFHCHIAQHYVAGMWALWRVYDTAQDDLAPLPDREASPAPVTSEELIGTEVEGKRLVPAARLRDPATERSLENWVERQLPPQGQRTRWDDATVWDWERAGTDDAPVYLGEPEDTRTWANFASDQPGERPEILFNPKNGRYAWPLLRPHLAMRPPFAPGGHAGTPWAGPTASEDRRDGLCPAGAPVRRFDITAITREVQQTPKTADRDGQIFVLNEDRRDVLAGRRSPDPLVIRANVGECVAVTLSSQLRDGTENHQYSKVNIHPHLVQFDPHGSDGVITGASFEQSVRPFPTEDRTLTAPASAGSRRLEVSRTAGLVAGVTIAVGQGEPSIEVAEVAAVQDGEVRLTAPLAREHAAGEAAGVEFVQYRWYADVPTSTIFYHDHVDGINSWEHGLYGALVVEPKGSTYRDPATGEPVRSGAIADIHTEGSVGAGQRGSFREFVCILGEGLRDPSQQSQALRNGLVPHQEGAINQRAEPLAERGAATDPDRFSSVRHGDPFTPLPRAYAGDPFVIRALGVTTLEGSLRVTGHRFRTEQFAEDSERADAATTGISERLDYVLEGGAGGPARKAGDYLYTSTAQAALQAGAWGLLRVHDTRQDDLRPLPGRDAPPGGTGFPQLRDTGESAPPATDPGTACPPGAPRERFEISMFAMPLPIRNNPSATKLSLLPGVGIPVPAAITQLATGSGRETSTDRDGVVYALTSDVAAIRAKRKTLEPLVLRVNDGDCVEIVLRNELPDGQRAGFNPAKLLFDPQGSYGAAIGLNPDSSVPAGGARTLRYFADRELGTSIALDLAVPGRQVHGAFGAIIVEPKGATYHDPRTGGPLTSGVQAVVRTPNSAFREHVALLHETEQVVGDNDLLYLTEVSGYAGLNYRHEPFEGRLQGPLAKRIERLTPTPPGRLGALTKSDPSQVFDSARHGDPDTTVMRAYRGDPVRFRVGVAAGNQWHSFALDAHQWPYDLGLPGTAQRTAETVGPAQSLDAHTTAGGLAGGAGDYLYGDHRMPFTQAGLWGLFRVSATQQPDLLRLDEVGGR